MKNMILSALAFVLLGTVQAQEKLPELTMIPGWFNTSYALDGKITSPGSVSSHLEANNQLAHYHFVKSYNQELGSAISSLVGVTGLLTGLLLKKPGAKAVAYGTSAVAFTTSVVFTIGYSSNRKKAINLYNKAAGY